MLGNLLVIVSVLRTKTLRRQKAYYFVVSLALAGDIRSLLFSPWITNKFHELSWLLGLWCRYQKMNESQINSLQTFCGCNSFNSIICFRSLRVNRGDGVQCHQRPSGRPLAVLCVAVWHVQCHGRSVLHCLHPQPLLHLHVQVRPSPGQTQCFHVLWEMITSNSDISLNFIFQSLKAKWKTFTLAIILSIRKISRKCPLAFTQIIHKNIKYAFSRPARLDKSNTPLLRKGFLPDSRDGENKAYLVFDSKWDFSVQWWRFHTNTKKNNVIAMF